jgi:protein-disulfide isomerase
MADKEYSLEKGEYVIGIAIILAALLVSATVYVSLGGLQSAVAKLNSAAGSAGTGGTAQLPSGGGQQAPPAQTPPSQQPQGVQKLSGLDYSKAYSAGKSDGKVIFVEYSDFQCPYCGEAEPTVVQLRSAYPDMQFIFRHYPLSFHPYAEKAAEAAECAGQQGKFWQMHDKMFADQSKLGVTDLQATAAGLGLDAAAFNSCLGSGVTAANISSEMSEGQRIGVTGTPGFLVYSRNVTSAQLQSKLQAVAAGFQQRYQLNAQVVQVDGAGNGILFAGALPYSDFKSVMDAFN